MRPTRHQVLVLSGAGLGAGALTCMKSSALAQCEETWDCLVSPSLFHRVSTGQSHCQSCQVKAGRTPTPAPKSGQSMRKDSEPRSPPPQAPPLTWTVPLGEGAVSEPRVAAWGRRVRPSSKGPATAMLSALEGLPYVEIKQGEPCALATTQVSHSDLGRWSSQSHSVPIGLAVISIT